MSAPAAGRRERLRRTLRRPSLWVVAFALFVGNWVISSHVGNRPAPVRVPYTVFRAQAERGNVAEVTSQRDEIGGRFRAAVRVAASGRVIRFETVRPAFAQDDRLLQLLIDHGTSVNARPMVTDRPLWQALLLGFGPAVLLLGMLVWLMGRRGGMSGLGRSRAKRSDASHERTTFADVAGIEEAEAELTEVVDFLRDPRRF